jgi:hypothetical protein
VLAWRLAPRPPVAGAVRTERAWAAGVAGTFGTALVIVFEWIVIAPDYVSVAWAATALVIGAIGLTKNVNGLRWQTYPLLMLALLHAIKPVLESGAASSIQLLSVLAVIAAVYGWSLVVRGAIAGMPKTIADVEDAVRMVVSVAATLGLTGVIYEEARPTLITVTWGLQAAALVVAGFPGRERLMRLSGLAVLVACVARLFLFDLPQLEELARIISFVALGAGLLAVSWIYTRYRDHIQKYL